MCNDAMERKNMQMLFSTVRDNTKHLHLDFRIDLDFVVNMFSQNTDKKYQGTPEEKSQGMPRRLHWVPVWAAQLTRFVKSLVAFFFVAFAGDAEE